MMNLLQEKCGMKGKVKPYDKHEVKDKKSAFSRTEKSVKPVTRDTNRTRRKMRKPTA